MRESKINKKDFDERPVLFAVKVIDEEILYLFHLVETLLDFEDYA